VPAVDRAFDYLVPDAMADEVRVGTIVRVPLHGRRVRGWVVADNVLPGTEPSRLLALSKVVGAGPPEPVIELCRLAAWRWAGTELALLRAASPPNAVREPWPVDPPGAPPHRSVSEVLAWPPAMDRRDLVADRIAPDGSTLVVVPDGARLGALVRHLERAGHRVLLMRSDDPDALRTRAWAAARFGRCVVVGGRVAVWAPVPDLERVIVLDEGDEALQEERSPTWHAREVAAARVAGVGASLTLVGVVPTPEAVTIAGAPVRPSAAAEREHWPVLEVVDLREEPPGIGLLSEGLARALHRAVDAGGRAVCVVNRKGRARLLTCHACDELARCERCGAAVVETDDRSLLCARCGTRRPLVCLRCHGGRMRVRRLGVARLRDDLAALLPRAEVAEVDATTEEIPDVPVLVGTEAVLHRVRRLPRARALLLVGFLDFDQELAAHRYRASQQAVALLARAARLLGARGGDGRLLVQTRLPDHEVLAVARTGNPVPLLDAETARRRELGYPPFGAVAELSGAPEAVRAALDVLPPEVVVLGPTEAPTGLRALAQAATVELLADALAEAGPMGRAEGRLRVAVDPPRV